jgi:hypothetical protein
MFAQTRIGHHAAFGQKIIQQRLELRLSPTATTLHVGKDPFQIADLRGDGLHVHHGFLNGGELIDHALEAGLHLAFHRLLQLLVHAALYLAKAQRAVLRHLTQLAFEQYPVLALI